MDTEGPVSVLDHRKRTSARENVIADRLTRQRSPGPGQDRHHHKGRRSADEEEGTDVIYRISQPYRTSFSAKHSVTFGKPDRSRSLSPTSSLQSDFSCRSMPSSSMGGGGRRRPRGRSKSPKRVTYDTRVTVRHSDADDSMFTELSRTDMDDDSPMRSITSPFSRSVISPRYNEFSHPPNFNPPPAARYYRDHQQRYTVRDVTNLKKSPSMNDSLLSKDSGLDYSAEIKDLSNQIMTMEWSPRQNRAVRARPPASQLAENQHQQSRHHHQQQRQRQPQHDKTHLSHHYPQHQQGQRHSPPSVSPHGILKDSRNSRGSRELQTGTVTSGHGSLNDGPYIGHRNSGSRSSSTRTSPIPSTEIADKENDPSQSPTRSTGSSSPVFDPASDVIKRDYEHRQAFSYQDAVDGKYGDELQKLAEKGLEDDQIHQQIHRQIQQTTLESEPPYEKEKNGKGKNGASHVVTGKPPAGRSPPTDDTCIAMPKDTTPGDSSPGRGSPTESGRLTPSKRSISLSITNFLKRFSPHLRRKRSKDRGSKSSSAGGSAQSLPTSDNNSDPESPNAAGSGSGSGSNSKTGKRGGKGHFSRSRVRSSLMKLVGKTKSKKSGKAKATDDVIPTPSHYTIELQDPDKTLSSDEVDEIINDLIINSNDNNVVVNNANGKPAFTGNAGRLMKSIQHNKTQEGDIYRKFKDRHSPRSDERDASSGKPAPLSPSSAVTSTTTDSGSPPSDATTGYSHSGGGVDNSSVDWTSSKDISMEFFTETDIKAILNPDKLHNNHQQQQQHHHHHRYNHSATPSSSSSLQLSSRAQQNDLRASPPTSLDVISPKNIRILQTSMMSSISGDDSIGECSLDVNLTASEPSLLSGHNNSQSGGSRQVAIPSSLVNSSESRLSPVGSDTEGVVKLRKHRANKENSVPSSESGSSSPSSPTSSSHIPSYLKLSCAVSGYGKYSRYSTYKDVNKPSPYSSQNSLRSACTSPEPIMPAERSGDELSPEHTASSRLRLTSNGHAPKYPTGDTAKDGEYFLQHTHFEEDRIRALSTRAEALMRSQDLPEEACGRIRSAIGKANLLLNQKFTQFRDLCYNHMQPDPEERETKWEDLQGFWDMVKIQIDNVDDMFAEIELMKGNGWQEIPKMPSRRSSASSSPKSGNVSQASTPCATPGHTPGSRRKNLKPSSNKDTPESSPERTQKARQAAKARDEARKKLLAERRAAMKQQTSSNGASSNSEVEIYLPDPPKK